MGGDLRDLVRGRNSGVDERSGGGMANGQGGVEAGGQDFRGVGGNEFVPEGLKGS